MAAKVPQINSSQPLAGLSFNGSAAQPAPLGAQVIIHPSAQLMHESSGNQGALIYLGPLGDQLNVSSYANPTPILWWGLDGGLSAAYDAEINGTKVLGLCALDQQSMEVLSSWYPSSMSEVLNVPYAELLLESNNFLFNSQQGNLYVVHRDNSNNSAPIFTTVREVNLTAHGILDKGETLLNGLFDTAGNMWFTTGAIVGNYHGSAQNSTTIGYVEPDGTIHAIHMLNEIIENGIAVSDKTMFIQTGPAGSNDHANATGNFYAFTAGQHGNASSVNVLWNETYDAGSAYKPNGFARGSGASPTLLGNDYVAFTDNADVQISVLVYNQTTGAKVCSVPIFKPNAGATDNALLNAFDGTAYGIVALNDYNASEVYLSGEDINGEWNNMTTMAPGLTRVDVIPQSDGTAECNVKWEAPIWAHAVPVLSVENGLLYTYTQDTALAIQGEYVWYAVALDFASGKEIWRARSGAGGAFNDDYAPGTLGPDGSFYQSVLDGIVVVKDGNQEQGSGGMMSKRARGGGSGDNGGGGIGGGHGGMGQGATNSTTSANSARNGKEVRLHTQ
jgi:hypothetical protein